ncbi:MAG: HAMP domain-containing histidine kinase [candidate division Zixibacteria bacterium]|nr:HAMP domain-containing histidine kinase [candidate division Zixibacteria bacterium]
MAENKQKDTYIEYSLFLKVFIIIGIIIMALAFVYYTQYIISRLKEDSKNLVDLYAKLWQVAASEQIGEVETEIIFEEVIRKSDFPIIVTDTQGNPQAWRDVGIEPNDTTQSAKWKLSKIIIKMDKEKNPIPIYYGNKNRIINYLHYGDSNLIRQLRWMPILEIGIVSLFILVSLLSFRSVKKSEERYIWVGMAKETAHQLGTPLSSLLGWLELLKDDSKQTEFSLKDISSRMESDVKRLQKIANRFSQIGSSPEVKVGDVNEIINEVVSYFRERVPKGGGEGVKIEERLGTIIPCKFNTELMSWVIENLVRNSLEAVPNRNGSIEISTEWDKMKNKIIIKVSDNGRGIATDQQGKIFKPGYTTKKRGWGLGLSLVKRIIKEYHSGRIYLEESIPFHKTTFVIILPVRV